MNTHNPSSFFHRNRRPLSDLQPRAEYAPVSVRTLTSESLFQGTHEIGIAHAGSLYRLKITRQGKLILNK
jgi:hemin uptake protein HemP